MRPLAATITVLLLIVSFLGAAQKSLTGRWEGKTPNNFEMVLELTAKETVLTGTLTRNGESADITDGTISKNSFSFKAAFNGQTAAMTGELQGDEIRMWMEQQGPGRAIILKRTNK